MTNEALLVINAGSSSIKFALFPATDPIPRQAALHGQIDGIGARPHLCARDATGRVMENEDLSLRRESEDSHHAGALARLVGWLATNGGGWRIVAVGHRVVHGGQDFAAPVKIDGGIMEALRKFVSLAPLHQPHNLAGVEAMQGALPDVPHVACFDTAFHRTQAPVAQLFALPRRITERGVRRYGFHGSSYEYIAHVLPEHLGERADGRIVVAHLGNGASMCSMKERRSVASTMGFTAVDGLMMGTRTGSMDPGVMIWLMEELGMDAKDLTRLLYKESGLLGVSGISQDMRELLASEKPEAEEAIGLFCYRIVRELASLAATLGGLDALVFTGGIGEHAAPVRERVCNASHWLGIELDTEANARHASRISGPTSEVDVLVLPTNEEWMIARHAALFVADRHLP